MKTCSKCGEMNGDNRETCWKCNNTLPASVSYRKMCPSCGQFFAPNVSVCPNCAVNLQVYDASTARQAPSESSDGCWIYAVSIVIPLVGIILGLIYIARGEDDLGKSVLITGVAASIFLPLMLFMFASCGALFF